MTTTFAGSLMSPLDHLEIHVREHVEAGSRVQIVFDLDDTLYLVRPRKRAIFRELADTFADDVALSAALQRLSHGHIPYDVREALNDVGIEAEHHIEAITEAFFTRFFDGAYTSHDELNEGAAAYVARLHAAGARVVYLSGRPAEMTERTMATLAAHGFPVEAESTHLVLKAAHDPQHDVAFKAAKAEELAGWGLTLAVFDNEPANLNAMNAAMPEATYFLLDTDHTPNPPEPAMDVHVVADFVAAARAHLAASLAQSPDFSRGGWSLDVASTDR